MSKMILMDRYELQEIVGEGGQAAVYKAYDRKEDDIIAIKRYLDIVKLGKEQVQQILDEIELLSKMNSPHVVKVYSGFALADSIFMVMELINGMDLYKLIGQQFDYCSDKVYDMFKKEKHIDNILQIDNQAEFSAYVLKHFHGRFQPKQLNEPRFFKRSKMFSFDNYDIFLNCVVQQLLSMFTYLQSDLNLMHRDIKPANIILNDRNILKLVDFGLCRQRAITNTICGTPGYMAPEICLGDSYTKKCDIYSMGCLIFELVCGYPPVLEAANEELEQHLAKNSLLLPPNLYYGDLKSNIYLRLVKFILNRDPVLRPSISECQEYYRSLRQGENIFHTPSGFMDINVVDHAELKNLPQSILKQIYQINILIAGLDLQIKKKYQEYDGSYCVLNQKFLLHLQFESITDPTQINERCKQIDLLMFFGFDNPQCEAFYTKVKDTIEFYNARQGFGDGFTLFKYIDLVSTTSQFNSNPTRLNKKLLDNDLISLLVRNLNTAIIEGFHQIEDSTNLMKKDKSLNSLGKNIENQKKKSQCSAF